jgi:hypothetical protein
VGWVKELSHFEAQREIEASPEGKRLGELSNPKICGVNFKGGLVNPGPVEPDDIIYTMLREHREPGP